MLSLPGIGPYSAAAIGSFAFLLPHVVVDGNVKRVIARFAGIGESIDEASATDRIRDIAQAYMKGSAPDVFNQAIMNFGALVCKPSSPLCESCPLSKKCLAYQHDIVEVLPVRSKKKETRIRFFHFIVLHHRDKILLLQREGKDIWKGLYAPPLLESNSERMPAKAKIISYLETLIGHNAVTSLRSSPTEQQLLSHQTIMGRFHHFHLTNKPVHLPANGVWVNKKTVHDYGKPKIIVSMMKNAFDNNPG